MSSNDAKNHSSALLVCHGGREYQTPAYGLLIFFLVSMVMSLIAQFLGNVMPKGLNLPHTVFLFGFGLFLSFVASKDSGKSMGYGSVIASVQNLDPHIIFWALLPPLLYEDAASVNWHVSARVLPNSIMLAVPGAMINTGLIACCIKLLRT